MTACTPGPSCSMQDLLAAACELFSCGVWDLVPWLGIEPGPHAMRTQSLSHWTTREVPNFCFFSQSVCFLFFSELLCLTLCSFFVSMKRGNWRSWRKHWVYSLGLFTFLHLRGHWTCPRHCYLSWTTIVTSVGLPTATADLLLSTVHCPPSSQPYPTGYGAIRTLLLYWWGYNCYKYFRQLFGDIC